MPVTAVIIVAAAITVFNAFMYSSPKMFKKLDYFLRLPKGNNHVAYCVPSLNIDLSR
jgi:hypothetical protein